MAGPILIKVWILKKGKTVSTGTDSATVSVGLTDRVAVSPPRVQDSSTSMLPRSDWEQTSHQPPLPLIRPKRIYNFLCSMLVL
jgi:hypothetical protein